jgi:hypothetical protein
VPRTKTFLPSAATFVGNFGTVSFRIVAISVIVRAATASGHLQANCLPEDHLRAEISRGRGRRREKALRIPVQMD